MKESEHLIAVAPGQNLELGERKVIQRFMPLLVAENLTRIKEYQTGNQWKRIDMWNCVGMRMDMQFTTQNSGITREEYSTQLLDDKYRLLGELGIDRTGRVIVRDDAEDTKAWLNKKIELLFSDGRIYIEKAPVLVCNRCDYVQGAVEARVSSCSKCSNAFFHGEDRIALFVDIPHKETLFAGKVYSPKKQARLAGRFKDLPPRMMISKTRQEGLSLDNLGLDGLVLDPKIGISLLPEMVASNHDLKEITQVQAEATSTHNIPYVSLLTDSFISTYVLLPKIPTTDINQARDMGIEFVTRYLPILLMMSTEDISESQIKQAQIAYEQITTKFRNVIYMLRSGNKEETYLSEEDREICQEIVDHFGNYELRRGLDKLKDFIRTLGRRYALELKKDGLYLCETDLDTLKDIASLIL